MTTHSFTTTQHVFIWASLITLLNFAAVAMLIACGVLCINCG